MNFRFLVFGFLFLISTQLKAQTEADPFIEEIIESITENADENLDYSELIERLNHYRKHPININKVTREQLQELLFLTPVQVGQLLNYQKENGKLIDLLELQSIDGFDLQTIRRLLPFITLSDSGFPDNLNFRKLISSGNSDLMLTYGRVIEQQAGYTIPDTSAKTRYLGSPYRLLTRYRYHYNNQLAASLTTEKDAGESFNRPEGFDFYSANVSFKGNGRLKKAVLGDYSLQFGQGLSLWSGLGFGKGASVTTLLKNEVGLKPYTSTNESLFLRGISGQVNIGKIDVIPFVSYRSLDAGLSDTEQNSEISSVRQTGLHRTESELGGRSNVKQFLYGSNVQFSNSSLRIGLTAYQTKFSRQFEKKEEISSYSFAGNRLTNLGTYYNYNWRNFYFFGEIARSLNKGLAYLNGSLVSLSPQVSLLLLHRNYGKDYHSFFKQAVSESAEASNERGFYSGIIITPNKKLEFTGYVDFFRFPGLRFRVDAPSHGHELFSQLSYSPTKKLKTSIRYKFETKEQNDDLENTINFLESITKQNARFEVSYKVHEDFSLKNRIEAVRYRKGAGKAESGFLLFQDVIYNPMRSKFSANLRYGIFHTDSFDARIYAYESDVLYSFSAPGFQNQGIRFYLNTRYRINKNTDLWARYAITSYSDIEEIGSGLDRIAGNNKSDFKLQLRFQF